MSGESGRWRTAPGPRPHRIAVMIVVAALRARIVRTIEDLGDSNGASPSTLRTWCRAAKLHPRDVVALTRALGAIHHASLEGVDPADLLDFADRRSLDPCHREGRTAHARRSSAQQRFTAHVAIIADVIRLIDRELNGR